MDAYLKKVSDVLFFHISHAEPTDDKFRNAIGLTLINIEDGTTKKYIINEVLIPTQITDRYFEVELLAESKMIMFQMQASLVAFFNLDLEPIREIQKERTVFGNRPIIKRPGDDLPTIDIRTTRPHIIKFFQDGEPLVYDEKGIVYNKKGIDNENYSEKWLVPHYEKRVKYTGFGWTHENNISSLIILNSDTLVTRGGFGYITIWRLDDKTQKTIEDINLSSEGIQNYANLPKTLSRDLIKVDEEHFITISNGQIVRYWNMDGESKIIYDLYMNGEGEKYPVIGIEDLQVTPNGSIVFYQENIGMILLT